mmetsp:Transcript_22836/g.47853  ORF Transcript_22836/g.47853 Transcript_22836/m.47853 type:complete len:336 (-) Transcript_22836:477-1484(-)|eukprot:CAMPEP_0171338712 /NCGR_PEP_ID=MMETSP0878-20121228/7495_1 /TAXON_ID=67004 /ORGANISM="Thalassiosira weissflogii, Strain CCMP1336" /LENGTH=335 /DNA_ID=CAMNT_0011840519 /DNA_START=52 /DNA_END=1059 /DNA_ORIENTATION=+
MLFSNATRSLASKTIVAVPATPSALLKSSLKNQVRTLSSTPPMISNPHNREFKRTIHKGSRLQYDAAPSFFPEQQQQVTSFQSRRENDDSASYTNPLVNRFLITAEVTVSKIFPAGFGWQASSILASDHLGYSSDTMAFALTTGLGDAIGVLAGHVAYFSLKKAYLEQTADSSESNSIDMERETQTGILLGTAALCSGTAWQPIVDTLQSLQLPFLQVFGGTWIGCGTAFYFGLRLGRTVLSGFFPHIHYPTFENGRTDKSLSAAIGGATGFFVGTDVGYLPGQNFLGGVVGIADGTSSLVGCGLAGSATSLGFVTAQSTLNAVYPRGRLWNDGK